MLYEGDRPFLVARRDIAAGEEVTCDYNINITGGTAWPCHCGAARCSGTTVGDFFQLLLDIHNESTDHSSQNGSCVPIVIG